MNDNKKLMKNHFYILLGFFKLEKVSLLHGQDFCFLEYWKTKFSSFIIPQSKYFKFFTEFNLFHQTSVNN